MRRLFTGYAVTLNPTSADHPRHGQLFQNGYNFDWLVERVSNKLGIEPQELLAPGKYARNVKARSLLCYRGERELEITTIELARRLNLAQPIVSQSVTRGQKIAENLGLSLKEKSIQ